MEENDVDGREGSQAGKSVQSGWLALVHSLLDALSQTLVDNRQQAC
jgi:hypothetical protein